MHSFPRCDKGCLNVNDCNECPFIDSVSEASDSTPPFTDEDISEQLLQTHGLTSKDWRKAQLQYLCLSFVIKCLFEQVYMHNQGVALIKRLMPNISRSGIICYFPMESLTERSF